MTNSHPNRPTQATSILGPWTEPTYRRWETASPDSTYVATVQYPHRPFLPDSWVRRPYRWTTYYLHLGQLVPFNTGKTVTLIQAQQHAETAVAVDDARRRARTGPDPVAGPGSTTAHREHP